MSGMMRSRHHGHACRLHGAHCEVSEERPAVSRVHEKREWRTDMCSTDRTCPLDDNHEGGCGGDRDTRDPIVDEALNGTYNAYGERS